MKEIIERVWDEAYSAWRFRWIGFSAAVAIAAIGWLTVLSLPDRYEANASVFVDTRTALRPALQGLTVEQDVSVQLNYVRQSLLTGDRLRQIAIQSGVLPTEEVDPVRIAKILDGFAARVALSVRNASPSGREAERDAGSIYSFKYQDGDRERGLRVMETVVNAFVQETLGGKRAGAEEMQSFLASELQVHEGRLRAAESKLADFKKEHVGLMPTEQGGFFAQLQAAIDAADAIQNQLNLALARRAELVRQLRGDAVVSATGMPSLGGGGGDTVSRMNEAQARLDELLLRFTDSYPDVVAARTTLEELRMRREREIEQLRNGDAAAAASSGVSGNPLYQLLQQQLGQADVEITSLRGQLAQQQARASDLRRRMDIAPRVEADFAQLNRDYEAIQAQYNALLQNYERAQLGERADEAGAVRFDIIQPATSPFSPVSPPRTVLLAGVLLAALAVGAALAFLLHLLRPVVASVRNLAELTDLPVLGVVSPAFPGQIAAKTRWEVVRFLAAGAALVALLAVVMVLNQQGLRFTVGAG